MSDLVGKGGRGLEWDFVRLVGVVLVEGGRRGRALRGGWRVALRSLRIGLRGGGLAVLVIALAARVGVSTTAIGKELEVFSDDFEFAAFFSRFFIVPRIHLKAAFDVNAAAFVEVLLGKVGLPAPEGDIDEDGFFLLLVLLVGPDTVDGQRDVGNMGSARGVTAIRVSGEIADEHDFV